MSNLVPIADEYLLGELRVVAERLGLQPEDYAYRSVERVVQKVNHGMSLARACTNTGLSIDKLREMAESEPRLKDLFYEALHRFEMRALSSLMAGVDSDPKLALEVLSRRNEDFAPARRSVEVTNIDIRSGMVLDVSD